MHACWRGVGIAALLVQGAKPGVAQWTMLTHTDEMTDQSIAAFHIRASAPTLGVVGQAVRPLLAFVCRDGRLSEVRLVHETYVTNDLVTLRFDRDSAYSEAWDNEALANKALLAAHPAELLDSVLLHRQVKIRYGPYGDLAQTASFVVGKNLAPVTAAFAHACGIDPAARTRTLQSAVGSIELAVRDTIHPVAPGLLAVRPLVKVVRDRLGRPLTDYTIEAQVAIPASGLTTMMTGDSIPLDAGTTTEVLLMVNHHPAPYAIRYEVAAGDMEP